MTRVLMICGIALFVGLPLILAGPVSDNYELKTYTFGSGGTDGSESDNFSMLGIVGEVIGDPGESDNFINGPGLVFTQQANLPAAPTFTNPGDTYDRLRFILDDGDNPSDAQFAIAISSDNFVTTQYIQSDNTPGAILGSEDWQTYAQWGSSTGEYVTNLQSNTTYEIKVKARHGNYTETGWSAESSAATSVPSLTFGVSSSSVTFDPLISDNSYTDSSKNTILTTSTNAYNGYTVYGRATDVLTSNANTIAHYTSPNSTPTSWTGTGFGYTTDDSSLAGGTANRFTSGGPNYAGFTNAAPGDPVADHTAVVDGTPITSEQFTVGYRVTAASTATAGTYTTTVIYVVVPEY